jgi:MFS family permease
MSTGPLLPLGGTGPLALPQAPVATSAGPLANPAFLRLWLAQGTSQVGDRVHQLALMWWTIQATGSLAMTGIVLIATTLPAVLLGPVAGALADRVPRKPLMLACDGLRALVTLLLAVLALIGDLSFPVVVVCSAALASLTAIFTPANMATVPSVVPQEDLLKANSLLETTMHGAGLLGPALGGLIVAVFGPAGAFGFNALSFVGSALALLGIRFPPPAPGAVAESFFASMKAGFRLLGAQPTIGGLLGCFAVLNFFSISILLFLPYFAKTVFQVGAAGLGVMEAAIATGMLLGALSAGKLGGGRKRFPVILTAVLGTCATFVVMGAVPLYPLFLAMLAVTGALFGGMNVVVMAFFQERVPPAEMGRFMGLLTSVVFALMPVSNGVFGALSGAVAPSQLLMINGGCIGAIAFLLFLVPGLRHE